MIEFTDVCKKYGQVTALDRVSFTAADGQIVGLLGRNGAGKTTALNILTGYMPPDSGIVRINGMDLLSHPRECKRSIGYLPERPPLYDEMTVYDQLVFVCRLREVDKKSIDRHVREIISLCGLNDVAGRVIGHLSKGYRQRIGIAQALCGDPDIIILDEPTVGLDPVQVAEIRELIRKLGCDHTVFFSSHILSEVQQLCNTVIILHNGRIVQICEPGKNGEQSDEIRLRLTAAGKEKDIVKALRSLDSIHRIRVLTSAEQNVAELELICARNDERGDIRRRIFYLLSALDAPILSMYTERETLEDVFLKATADD